LTEEVEMSMEEWLEWATTPESELLEEMMNSSDSGKDFEEQLENLSEEEEEELYSEMVHMDLRPLRLASDNSFGGGVPELVGAVLPHATERAIDELENLGVDARWPAEPGYSKDGSQTTNGYMPFRDALIVFEPDTTQIAENPLVSSLAEELLHKNQYERFTVFGEMAEGDEEKPVDHFESLVETVENLPEEARQNIRDLTELDVREQERYAIMSYSEEELKDTLEDYVEAVKEGDRHEARQRAQVLVEYGADPQDSDTTDLEEAGAVVDQVLDETSGNYWTTKDEIHDGYIEGFAKLLTLYMDDEIDDREKVIEDAESARDFYLEAEGSLEYDKEEVEDLDKIVRGLVREYHRMDGSPEERMEYMLGERMGEELGG
jgi:hypothetical protein